MEIRFTTEDVKSRINKMNFEIMNLKKERESIEEELKAIEFTKKDTRDEIFSRLRKNGFETTILKGRILEYRNIMLDQKKIVENVIKEVNSICYT